MSGYSSLSFEEWNSKNKKMIALQKKETVDWLKECWYESHDAQLKEEIAQIRKTVPVDILKSVLNGKYDPGKPNDSEKNFCLSYCFRESEPARSIVWFKEFKDIIDWDNDTVGAKDNNWLGAAMQADYSTQYIEEIESVALSAGWSWKNITLPQWERLFFLNAVSDCQCGFHQDWLFHRAEACDPKLLKHQWANTVIEKGVDDKIFLDFFNPMTNTIFWLSTGSSDEGCSGLIYWQKKFKFYEKEDVDWCLKALNIAIEKDGQNVSLLSLKTKEVVLGFISEIEKEKLTERIGSHLMEPSINAL